MDSFGQLQIFAGDAQEQQDEEIDSLQYIYEEGQFEGSPISSEGRAKLTDPS